MTEWLKTPELVEAFNSGLGRAAKWHDAQARDCDSIAAVNQDNELGWDASSHAIDHRMAASDIRALKITYGRC